MAWVPPHDPLTLSPPLSPTTSVTTADCLSGQFSGLSVTALESRKDSTTTVKSKLSAESTANKIVTEYMTQSADLGPARSDDEELLFFNYTRGLRDDDAFSPSTMASFKSAQEKVKPTSEPLAVDSSFRSSTGSNATSRNAARLRIPSPVEEPSINFQSLTFLDISKVPDAVEHIWWTGRLPAWLRNFTNLRVLRAPSVGLIVLDNWLCELTELEDLQLQQNSITTWPHFLAQLPKLKRICMDGNPCLERALQKSPTLRAAFFSWNGGRGVYKQLPRLIRGPEWSPAAIIRSSGFSITSGSLSGFYCGGIYTLHTPPKPDTDGLLTVLEPCALHDRLLKTQGPSSFIKRLEPLTEEDGFEIISEPEVLLPPCPETAIQSKHARIIIDILRDISILITAPQLREVHSNIPQSQSSNSSNSLSPRRKRVSSLGSLSRVQRFDSRSGKSRTYTEACRSSQCSTLADITLGLCWTPVTYLTRRRSELSWEVVGKFCAELLRDEELYAKQLDAVMRYFFSRRNRAAIVRVMREIFNMFPELYQHRERTLAALRKLVSATARPRTHPKFNSEVARAIADVTTTLRRGQYYYEQYGISLANAEAILRRETVGDSKTNVGVSSAAHTMTMLLASSENRDAGALAAWLEKRRSKRGKAALDPGDFLPLPYLQCIKYDRYFSSFARRYPCFECCANISRRTKEITQANIAWARRNLRARELARKYRVVGDRFADYLWDAVFEVKSRSYLERGILSLKTNDVCDPVSGGPMSFVKEILDSAKHNIRFVASSVETVQIWDDSLEHYIGSIGLYDFSAKVEPCEDDGTLVRLHFFDVRETCIGHVLEFTSLVTNNGSTSSTDAFLEVVGA